MSRAMAETDIATMTFELLKRMQGPRSRIEADAGDLKVRMSVAEVHLGQITAQIGAVNGRMDRLDERIGRIERRLEPIDA
jgi:hypothetical protein